MNVLSIIFFLLGLASAALFSVGMDPYSCGIPLALMGVALAFSCDRGNVSWAQKWMACFVFLSVGYFGWRMHASPIQDFGRSDGLLLAGVFGTYWWTMSQKSASLKWVVFLLWGLLVVNVAIAAVQAYVDTNYYSIFSERIRFGFPSGLYLHYNHFANFLLGIGLLSFGLALDGERKRLVRILALLMFGLAVFGVVLSNSRGAIFGLGSGIFVALIGWLLSLWRRKVDFSGIALVITLALSPLLVVSLRHLGAMAVERRGMVDGCRMQFAGMAMDLIEEKPLIGGGSRSFFFDCFSKWDPKHLYLGSRDPQYVHNEYLQAAVDYGLVGAGILFVIFCATFFRGVTFLTMTHKNDGGDTGFVIGSIAGLVAMGVQAFFSFVYHVLPDLMLMSFCLALILRQPWIFAQDGVPRKQRIGKWLMPALSVLLGTGIIGFAARDGMAWLKLGPPRERGTQTREEQIASLKQALSVRPDFRVMTQLTKLMADQASAKDVTIEERARILDDAINIQNELVKRAPLSFGSRLNLALLYDAAGRYNESSPIYRNSLDDDLIYEIVFGHRYYYTMHLFSRGNKVWRERDPEKALACFLKARSMAAEVKNPAHRTNTTALTVEIEKCIKFLEGANIKPAASEE